MTNFEIIFIEMFLLFFGIFFLYSAITKDPLFWDTITTKELITFFGEKGTRILEYFLGTGTIIFVVIMLIRL